MSVFYDDLQFTTFPMSQQTFITMLNMTANDGSLIKQYQAAMEDGDATLARSIYAQITNADAKFIDAVKLNTLMQTCVALQRFYKTDIEPYIDVKQDEWQGIIDEFKYQGLYNPTVQYTRNNFVQYVTNGINLVYLCIATPPSSNIPPNNPAYWRVMTIQGVKGESGDGLAFLYEWSGATAYDLEDLVSYENKLWGCTLPNTNQPPYEGSVYWQVVGSIGQTIYPFQSFAPTGQSVGELWFKAM